MLELKFGEVAEEDDNKEELEIGNAEYETLPSL